MPHGDHHHHPPAEREIALREAEEACLRRGAQLTPLRRRVLEMVL